MEAFTSHSGVKQRSDYIRTCLVNGSTKYMEIKHRCSKTQFKATVAMPEVLSCGEELGRATLLVPAPCFYNAKQMLHTCFAFYLLWSKQKSPSDFFPLERELVLTQVFCKSRVA